jgi:hypothetical protein
VSTFFTAFEFGVKVTSNSHFVASALGKQGFFKKRGSRSAAAKRSANAAFLLKTTLRIAAS